MIVVINLRLMSKINVLFFLILISSFLLIQVNTLRISQRFKLRRSSLSNSGLSNAVGATLLGITSGAASSSLFTRPTQTPLSPLSQNRTSPFVAVKREEQRLAAIRAAQIAKNKNSTTLTNNTTNSTNLSTSITNSTSSITNSTSSTQNKTNSTITNTTKVNSSALNASTITTKRLSRVSTPPPQRVSTPPPPPQIIASSSSSSNQGNQYNK